MQFFFAFWLWMSRFLFPCSMNIRHHVYFLWAVTGQCWYIFGLWTSDCFLTWTSMENFVPGKSARPAEAVSEVLEVCVQQEAVQVAVAEGLEKKKDGVQELIKLRCEWEWAKLFFNGAISVLEWCAWVQCCAFSYDSLSCLTSADCHVKAFILASLRQPNIPLAHAYPEVCNFCT